MPMLSTFYSVNITALSGPANSDGFIDATKIETYMANGSTPTTVAQTITKTRGNVRYQNLIQCLGIIGNMYVTSPVATGANAITDPTSFSFNVQCERGDAILSTPDELNTGQILTGSACIKRAIARGMLIVQNDEYASYYDPTFSNASVSGATVSFQRVGTRIGQVVTGKLANTISQAEAAITVTKINI